MKRLFFLISALSVNLLGFAHILEIKSFQHIGPIMIQKPYMIDSIDVNSKAFDIKEILNDKVDKELIDGGSKFSGNILPTNGNSYAMNILGFYIENHIFTKAKINIEGIKDYQCFIDGKKIAGNDLELEPKTHLIVVKCLAEGPQNNKFHINIETTEKNIVTLREDGKRMYTLEDVLHNKRFSGNQLSPNGKFLITSYMINQEGGGCERYSKVTDLGNNQTLAIRNVHLKWMPKSNLYYYTRKGIHGKELVTVDPLSGQENVLIKNLPEGQFSMSPTEDYLLYTLTKEGPAEKEEIYEILEPDDRQPGWRDRSYLARYDMKSGTMQPLTFGFHNNWAVDISKDGKFLLIMTSRSRLTQRPTTIYSLYRLNLLTMEADKLIEDDGFISGAGFSPDGQQIYITGSPEALGGIGKNVKRGQIPSMYDVQLFIMNIADKSVYPATKDFHPSVQKVQWNETDRRIYFTAENRDYVCLYRLNPENKNIEKIETREDLVNSFSLANESSLLTYYGQSASNSDRLYTLTTNKLKHKLIEDLSKENIKDIELGECQPWNFINSKGDTIYGRYYLPPHFDRNKKYPMIVNYYGGCSPVERSFEGRYPLHAYAALGYIVYVVEPSGSSGFGQDFASRHVNTAGEGPAQDIIEGTKKFSAEHEFVNAEKIGCIGASYGGFMTQYLQTQTDIFAAAISHAGISDHTSYWGEGYWGYSYSEVSMANSYPWKNKELYVDRSPLFNAEKIKTPILFLHGDDDHNVPVGESIQMYTALKLLGKETAMVLVSGQDHHIKDYQKRILWEHTIYAWFAKWLQDNDTWWNNLYPQKAL